MSIEMVCYSDMGQVREHNEDSIACDESLGLVVLADGMGGCQAGEVASKMAVTIIVEQLSILLKTSSRIKRHANHRYHEATVFLEQAILKANQAIYEMAEQHIYYQGMGTTVVAVLFHHNFISIAHVGDSRLYRLRGNHFCQLTKDHSVNQDLIDCGIYTLEQARRSPIKHLITRALGLSEKVEVEIQEKSILAQDIYLLCSDGLNDMLEDSNIHTILNSSSTLEQAAQFLIDAANAQGGEDNISLILARPLHVAPKPQKRWWQWLFG